MIWVQSILFFILGAAVAGFLVVLVFPLVWRRALFLADKAVRMEIPVSLNEIEVECDFLRAEHATAVARLEQLLTAAENRYTQILHNYSQMREHNFYLLPFEKTVNELSALNKKLHAEIIGLKSDLNNANRLLRGQEVLKKQLQKLEVSHQKSLFTIKALQKKNGKYQTEDELTITALKGDIQRLNAQNTDLQKMHDDALNVLRQQIKIMAAMLVADVATKEGEDSPILQLIAKAENPDSLAALIQTNVISLKNQT